MTRVEQTGRSPNAQPCPRCGKLVAVWWNGKFSVYPRHKAGGKWCRVKRPPRG